MNTYTFYYFDGTREVLQGNGWYNTFKHANRQLNELNFHVPGECNLYEYNTESGEWVRVEVVA